MTQKTLAYAPRLCYNLHAAVLTANPSYKAGVRKPPERGKKMKADIQPKYYQAKVTCNCGNEFVTGSTKSEIHVEVCSKCHPFYTGQQKAAAARGRVDKFNKKYGLQ